MKRSVVFSAYSADNIIKDYIVQYLYYLHEIASEIIFVADCEYAQTELDKIKPYISHYICKRHNEYDFGSYKRGFQYLLKINNDHIPYDEVIFCNDSCFCLDSLFSNIITMENYGYDFWGMTGYYEITKHLQSYFLVFNKKVVNSNVFVTYLNNVKQENDYYDIVRKYEVPLLNTLESEGFKGGSVSGFTEFNAVFRPQFLMSYGIPLIKRKYFLSKHRNLSKYISTVCAIKKQFPNGYQVISEYFNKNFYEIYISSWIHHHSYVFKPFAITTFSSGMKKITFFGIPIIFYKNLKK